MSLNIDTEIVELIKREGGYSNNPNDAGGETNFGITAAVARAFGYAGPVATMPIGIAVQIYKLRYWTQPNFDKVATLNADIAAELFDTGVNMGVPTAGKFLQRALNVLGQQGKLYPRMGVDGSVGMMTIDALRRYLAARTTNGSDVLLRMLNAQQSVRYLELAEANVSQEQFEFGWQANRVS